MTTNPLRDRWHRLPVLARVVGVVVLVEVVVIAGSFGSEWAILRVGWNDVSHPTKPPPAHDWRQYEVPPVRLPAVVSAERAGLADEEVVVGVEAGGKARAYRLSALHDRRSHVVNDVVGGVPVSVAYCDLTDCLRAYTDPHGSDPLEIGVGGLYDGEMAIKVKGSLYLHHSSEAFRPGVVPFPYETLTPERTTWKEWKERHPATDVFVGRGK